MERLDGDTEGEPAARGRNGCDTSDRWHADWDKRLAEEMRKAFDAGRERGREEARTAETRGTDQCARARKSGAWPALVESFTVARDGYLHAVEQ